MFIVLNVLWNYTEIRHAYCPCKKKKKNNKQITKPDYYIDYLFKKDENIKTSNRPRQYLVAEFLLNTTTSALALRESDWLGKMSSLRARSSLYLCDSQRQVPLQAYNTKTLGHPLRHHDSLSVSI